MSIKDSQWILNNLGHQISLRSVANHFFIFRGMISAYLREFMPLLILPGPIEIDETYIGAKRRGNHGGIP